jgi:hypothetical protein
MTKIELLEPSMADVLKAIDAATDLSQTKKTHWSCSVRQICVGIGRPPESIPGRWSGVNAALQRLHHAHLGCNPKTLSNHKANVKACLAWFAGIKNFPKRGSVLSPVWAALWERIPDRPRRQRLSGPVRFASAIRPCDLTLLNAAASIRRQEEAPESTGEKRDQEPIHDLPHRHCAADFAPSRRGREQCRRCRARHRACRP